MTSESAAAAADDAQPRIPGAEILDIQEAAGSTLPTAGAGVADEKIAAVVAAAVDGDATAWNVLFNTFHATVRRYAMARSGDPEVADEVAQEVFVAAVGGLPGLRDRSRPSVESWLLRVARNKLVDASRRDRRERTRRVDAPAGVDPEAVATVNLEAARVREALRALTEDQREVLVRRFVLDQSLEQVATGLGKPVGAVKSLQHRALAAVERQLGERPDDHRG